MGIETGQEISPFYDPMIGKVIAWGPDREAARRRLLAGLKQSLLIGPTTNQRFLIDILEQDAFIAGAATTAFLEEHLPKDRRAAQAPALQDALCAPALLFCLERAEHHAGSVGVPDELLNWSSGGRLQSRYVLEDGDTRFELLLTPMPSGALQVHADGADHRLEVLSRDATRCTLQLDGQNRAIGYLWHNPGEMTLACDGRVHRFKNTLAQPPVRQEAAGSGVIAAPMPALVLDVTVAPGGRVARGDVLAVIEAMKMQHEIRADTDGVVVTVDTAVGAQVSAGDQLVQIAAED
jgi:geranyl-CoA carboxylase alpha subunit